MMTPSKCMGSFCSWRTSLRRIGVRVELSDRIALASQLPLPLVFQTRSSDESSDRAPASSAHSSDAADATPDTT